MHLRDYDVRGVVVNRGKGERTSSELLLRFPVLRRLISLLSCILHLRCHSGGIDSAGMNFHVRQDGLELAIKRLHKGVRNVGYWSTGQLNLVDTYGYLCCACGSALLTLHRITQRQSRNLEAPFVSGSRNSFFAAKSCLFL